MTRQLYKLSNAVTGLPVFPETIDRYCSSPLRALKIHTKRATIYSIEGVIAKQSFHLSGELCRELNKACVHLAAGLVDRGVNPFSAIEHKVIVAAKNKQIIKQPTMQEGLTSSLFKWIDRPDLIPKEKRGYVGVVG